MCSSDLIEIAFYRIHTLKTAMLLLQAQFSFGAIVHPAMERRHRAWDRVPAFTQCECKPRPMVNFIGS